MAVRSWPTAASARAWASGLDRFHWASSARLTASSTLRRPCSSWSLDSRGTGPACSQRSWMERRADLRRPPVGDRQQRLRLDEELLLGGGVAPELGLLGGEDLRAGREELVLGAAEPLPELGLVIPAGPAGFLPLPHQLAVGARRARPVGRVGQRLGLLDELLLVGLDRIALGLKRGEVGLAPLGKRVPRGRQPLPQHRLDRPVGVRGGLPLLEQLGHPLAALLPVRGLGRDVLGLVDDPLLDPAGLAPGLLAGGLDFLPALVDRRRSAPRAGSGARPGRRSRSPRPRPRAAAARWPGPGRGRPRSSSSAARAARSRSRARRTCAGRTRAPLPGCPPPTSRSPARHRRYARRPSRRRLPDPRDRWRWSRRTSWFSSRPGVSQGEM